MIRSYPAVSLGKDKFSQAVAYLPVCKHPAKILLSVNIWFTLYFNFGLEGANCMSLNPCQFNLETGFMSNTEDTAKDQREERFCTLDCEADEMCDSQICMSKGSTDMDARGNWILSP